MNLEFFDIIKLYLKTRIRHEVKCELIVLIILSLLTFIFPFFREFSLYEIIKDTCIPIIGILFGFSIAALTLLLSSSHYKDELSRIESERSFVRDNGRGTKKIKLNLYNSTIISFSYPIVIYSLLFLLFFIASIIGEIPLKWLADIGNSIFFFLLFEAIFATLRMISELFYASLTGLK